MTEMKEQCIYFCGPYQGYCGRAEWSQEEDSFHGEVVGVRDVVTFQGRTQGELKEAFRDSVDDYLAFCKKRKESPEKPFSGKFLLRVDPQIHRKLATLAEIAGKSLNQFVCEVLTAVAESSPVAAPRSLTDNGARCDEQIA